MKWRPSSDCTEAAEQTRMAEDLGDFSLFAITPLELFLVIAVVVLAIALLAIWGPAAIDGVLDAWTEASQ